MDTNKMREQFETWECDAPQGPQTDPMWLIYNAESNTYGLDKIQERWEAWQASREAVVFNIGEGVDECTCPVSVEGFWIQAIESQGLKVSP